MVNDKTIIKNILRNMEDSVISIPELKNKVKDKINNDNLKLVLNKLQEEGKILIGSKGITWIYSTPKHLKLMLKNSLEI